MYITVVCLFRLHCLYIVNFRFVIYSLCTDLMWTKVREHTCKNEMAKLQLQVSAWEYACVGVNVPLYCRLLNISHSVLLPLTLGTYFLLINARFFQPTQSQLTPSSSPTNTRAHTYSKTNTYTPTYVQMNIKHLCQNLRSICHVSWELSCLSCCYWFCTLPHIFNIHTHTCMYEYMCMCHF